MKRVLLTTYPEAFLYHGGGEREIHLLREALNSAGILVDIYGSTSLPLDAYDVVIHFSMIAGVEGIVEAVRNSGKRLILWPNLWFITEPAIQDVSHLAEYLSHFDAVVFKSRAEEAHFLRYFDLSEKRILHVTPLVSPKFSRREVSDVFRETHQLGDYAIWPGIIEPQKNQLAAVRAFQYLDADLVISGEVRDHHYYEACRSAAGANVHFLSAMPFGSEVHLSALANSKLFIELPLDFPGTSALEAALMGCQLLLTRCDWCEEMLGDRCRQVVPVDEAAIRLAVMEMFESGSTDKRGNSQRREIGASVEPLVRYLNECD